MEELRKRNRELARERWRKAKDLTCDRAEREELRNQGQGAGQKERQK